MDLTERFDPSLALAAILSCESGTIVTRTPPDLPAYLLPEALAQSCGMQLRFRHDFRIAAFLASVADLVYAKPPTPVIIRARLVAETGMAARYEACADSGEPCRITIGYRPAPADTFFRHRFQCLTSPSSTL